MRRRDIVNIRGCVFLGELGFDLGVLGCFDNFSFLECGSGTDQRDIVRGIDDTPATFIGSNEFERHRGPGGPRAEALVARVRGVAGSATCFGGPYRAPE